MKHFRDARRPTGANILLLLLIAGAVAAVYFVFKYLVTEVFDTNSLIQVSNGDAPIQMAIYHPLTTLKHIAIPFIR